MKEIRRITERHSRKSKTEKLKMRKTVKTCKARRKGQWAEKEESERIVRQDDQHA